MPCSRLPASSRALFSRSWMEPRHPSILLRRFALAAVTAVALIARCPNQGRNIRIESTHVGGDRNLGMRICGARGTCVWTRESFYVETIGKEIPFFYYVYIYLPFSSKLAKHVR